jgi:hypothetical protein
MTQTCSKCSRLNPREAAYCYYDGTMLDGRGNGGPVKVGSRPFHSPFVFPSGLVCRNFDEFVLACQEHWGVVLGLLQQGYLESFLSSQGRMDLALAAREAAKFPDRERGLDQLLAKLPSGVLRPPRLRVEPGEINLGLLHVGEDRRFEMALENQGMRLLYGSVTCVECPWLSVGDTEGVQQKLFQFSDELALPVHVRGRFLRASAKPQEGRIVIDSNGGKATVLVRIDVPVQAFPEGVLAGALSPRQMAEKAKAVPKDAAGLMESGAVARWYQQNGWKYPVQGPPASGLGAVQQLFEALGLTTPPRVEISERTVQLAGRPGEKLEHALFVKAQEKRPVYAHGASDEPWLEVGRARLNGRTATIPLTVPAVPDRPGETLESRVKVAANGNQRFAVTVRLTVTGAAAARVVDGWGSGFGPPVRKATPVVEEIQVVKPIYPVPIEPVVPTAIVEAPPPPRPVRARPAARAEAAPPPRAERRVSPLVHLLPVLFIVAGLLAAVAHDRWWVPDEKPPEQHPAQFTQDGNLIIDPEPRLELQFHDRDVPVLLGKTGMKPGGQADSDDGTHALWRPSMRFGLVARDPKDPGRPKRLTFKPNGLTNNTVVRLDGNEWIFGDKAPVTADGREIGPTWPGHWSDREHHIEEARDGGAWVQRGVQSVWVYDDQHVVVTQTVDVVPGEQSHRLDTCRVRYKIENKDTVDHRVGLRFLLDTYIGDNDGVPFLLPGRKQLYDTMMDLNRRHEVPDFMQALEKPDLSHPGTIAHLQLKLGGSLEPPDRVTLGAWPNAGLSDRRCREESTLWEVPLFSMQSLRPPDSAVTIYWDARNLPPGTSREVGFAYGLGAVASDEGGQLGLTVGGSFVPEGQFTVTAYVRNPRPGQTVTLEVPEGFTLVDGERQQPVPPLPPEASSRISPVTWKVQAPPREGQYTLKVQSSTGVSQKQDVTIKRPRRSGLFD